MNYRPEWLPRDEVIEAFCASSGGTRGYKTRGLDGTLYIWRNIRPKRFRKKRWVKTRTFKTQGV